MYFVFENVFHKDRYGRILTSVHKHVIFIEHINCSESIYGILLDYSPDICFLACPCIADESLPIEVR